MVGKNQKEEGRSADLPKVFGVTRDGLDSENVEQLREELSGFFNFVLRDFGGNNIWNSEEKWRNIIEEWNPGVHIHIIKNYATVLSDKNRDLLIKKADKEVLKMIIIENFLDFLWHTKLLIKFWNSEIYKFIAILHLGALFDNDLEKLFKVWGFELFNFILLSITNLSERNKVLKYIINMSSEEFKKQLNNTDEIITLNLLNNLLGDEVRTIIIEKFWGLLGESILNPESVKLEIKN